MTAGYEVGHPTLAINPKSAEYQQYAGTSNDDIKMDYPLIEVKLPSSMKGSEGIDSRQDNNVVTENYESNPIYIGFDQLNLNVSQPYKPSKPAKPRIKNDLCELVREYQVGIDQIAHQQEELTARKGINFTIMVAGRSGLGKTTFINTLFDATLLPNSWRSCKEKQKIPEKTKAVVHYSSTVEDFGTSLHLTVIDTPGFGNKSNNAFSWTPLVNCVDDQMRSLVFQEEQPDRSALTDKRIHCCLYFIDPTNKGIGTLDVVTIKELSKRVNLIPIIAKADSLTANELVHFKQEVREILEVQGIQPCRFLDIDDPGNSDIFDYVPFSVVSSESFVLNDRGELVRGREYKWGTIEVENPKHSDFMKLKECLLNRNLVDLVKGTESYYESCRASLLKTRILKARDICMSRPLETGYTSHDIREFFKSLDYDNLDSNGLKNYACYQIMNKKYMDEMVVEWCQEFIHRQWESKRKFNKIVSLEEKRFQEWKKALVHKQKMFAQDIDGMNKEIDKLQLQCQDLEAKVTASRTRYASVSDSHFSNGFQIK